MSDCKNCHISLRPLSASEIIGVCSKCSHLLGHERCSACFWEAIENNVCLFCSNPKSGSYYTRWIRDHRENPAKIYSERKTNE
jgi:hypothetical protein